MSFIDFIEKIQKKPRHVRVRILWVFVFVCSFFVVSFWITSLKYSVTDTSLIGTKNEIGQAKDKVIKDALQKANITTSDEKKTPSLMEALKASVSSFFEEELEEQAKEIKSEPSIQKGGSETIKPTRLPLSE